MKKETVLTVAWLLAALSAFFVTPDGGYVKYIDFKSLGTLWSLMTAVAGLTEAGLFDKIGEELLKKTKSLRQLLVLLVFLPFISSMFITNDVALLTFVPFAMHMLKMSGRKDRLIPVIALQTVAANLGSMLTPIGNPQNLYLYGLWGKGAREFVLLMLPYTALSAVMIFAGTLIAAGHDGSSPVTDCRVRQPETHGNGKNEPGSRHMTVVYCVFFVLAVLSVAFPDTVKYYYVLALILCVCLFMNRRILAGVDYALLLTFVGFFIFTGNLGRIAAVRNFMTGAVGGREVAVSVISSQFISNVPAALLLSEFTENIKMLIIGVNLGGLGTLIASMASLISFKMLAHEENGMKGRYLVFFTGISILFLAVLFAFCALLSAV